MKFTFGTDPEFMIQDNNGKMLSAIGIIPGTKYETHKVGTHAFYYDNVLAECAVAPGTTKEKFLGSFRDCMQKFAKLAQPNKLITRGAANFKKDQLQHQDAKTIGCDPEFCCYELIAIKPDEKKFAGQTLRTAGGHIHLGSTIAQDEYNRLQIVRMLDLFLAIPSIYIDHDPTASIRKRWYGKAGRFRAPQHGVEYRSLSNFWLASPFLVSLIYDICSFVLQFVEEGRDQKFWFIDKKALDDDKTWALSDFHPSKYHHCIGYNVVEMRKAVDTMNKNLGKSFMTLIKDYFPKQLFDRIQEATKPKTYEFYKEWEI